MKWVSYETHVYSKWVLAGEHTVLRGASAIALPNSDFSLTLRFSVDRSNGLTIFPEESEATVKDMLNSIIVGLSSLAGTLKIENSIPIGAGLGSSAALCVALARWLQEPLAIKNLAEFARTLEHRFHGWSSGLDCAAVLSNQPISFSLVEGVRTLGIRRLPKFTFHDTGLRAKTSDCIAEVEKLRQKDARLADQIDGQMMRAAQESLDGLRKFDAGDSAEGMRAICQAMRWSQECFMAWNLVPPSVLEMSKSLLGQGARAVKLTGSGNGGMLAAIW